MFKNALFGLYVTVIVCLLSLINVFVPNPYMDEIFHIPQGLHLPCPSSHHSPFYYDPLLTTPPGLYLSSAPFILGLRVLEKFGLLSQPWACSNFALRSFNTFFYALGTLRVLGAIRKRLYYSAPKFTSNVMAFFPLSFFFHFLYYTDSGSTFWVLLGLYLAIQQRYAWSAFASLISMTFRQTNVVWMIFIAGISALDILGSLPNVIQKSRFGPLKRLKKRGSAKKRKEMDSLFFQTVEMLSISLENWGMLIKKLWGFIIAGILFGAFVIWNGGIVLGDKSHHIATQHWVQLYYFASFLTFFALPVLDPIRGLRDFYHSLTLKKLGYLLILGGLMAWTISNFTQVYWSISINTTVWNIPFYYLIIDITLFIFGAGFSDHILGIDTCSFQVASMGIFAAIGYIIAVVLTLVPSPLLEFRYFIIPYLIFRVFVSSPSIYVFQELLLYTAVNIFTFIIFFNRTFEWPSEPGKVQRFMW